MWEGGGCGLLVQMTYIRWVQTSQITGFVSKSTDHDSAASHLFALDCPNDLG